MTVTGNGAKGKAMKTKYGFALAVAKATTELASYTYQYLRLPEPNVNNIGDEMYHNPGNLSLGMGPGIGLPARTWCNNPCLACDTDWRREVESLVSRVEYQGEYPADVV